MPPIRKRGINELRGFCSDPQNGYWSIGARESQKRKRTRTPKAEAIPELASCRTTKKMNTSNEASKEIPGAPKTEEQRKMATEVAFCKMTKSNENAKPKSIAGAKENRKQKVGAGKQQQQPTKTHGRPHKNPPTTTKPPKRGKSGSKTDGLLPSKPELFRDAVRRAKELLVLEHGPNYSSDDLVILV